MGAWFRQSWRMMHRGLDTDQGQYENMFTSNPPPHPPSASPSASLSPINPTISLRHPWPLPSHSTHPCRAPHSRAFPDLLGDLPAPLSDGDVPCCPLQQHQRAWTRLSILHIAEEVVPSMYSVRFFM